MTGKPNTTGFKSKRRLCECDCRLVLFPYIGYGSTLTGGDLVHLDQQEAAGGTER